MAKEFLAEFAGESGGCPDDPKTGLFVAEVVQRMLHRGANGAYRKWCFTTCDGCITLPWELETPVRYKIDGQTCNVWDHWFEFHEAAAGECDPDHCKSEGWVEGLYIEPWYYPTVFELPCGGAHVYASGRRPEDCDSHIIVQGLDSTGKPIYVPHKDEQILGEYLPIRHNKPQHSECRFHKITGVYSTQTTDYKRLYWHTPENGKSGLLVELRPEETVPQYRRVKIKLPACSEPCCHKVEILGRVRDPQFKYDNEILPVTSLPALKTTAKLIQEEKQKSDPVYSNRELDRQIQDEHRYRQGGKKVIDNDSCLNRIDTII